MVFVFITERSLVISPSAMPSAAAFSSIASMVLIILMIVRALAGSKDDVGYIGGRIGDKGNGKGDGNDDIGGKSKCETKQRPRGSGVHSLAS